MSEDIVASIGDLIIFEKVKSCLDPNTCDHLHVSCSKDLAHITCKDCKEKLDPIQWVLMYIDLLNKYKAKTDMRLAQLQLIEERIQSKAKFFCNSCHEVNNIDFSKLVSLKAIERKMKVLESDQ